MSRKPDASAVALDRLYQAPLADFTAERNALAKAAGPAGAAIRALQKPSVPAWAVNQLYWRRRELYDELLARAEDLRATHHEAMRGGRADIRGASAAHDEALKAAFAATVSVLEEAGVRVTDATRQAILTTLRALPSEEAPGRLTRPLQPRGFAVLGGATSGTVRHTTSAPRSSRPAAKAKPAKKADAQQVAAAEASVAAARSALREAETAARRQEFEAARLARDAERAAGELRDAERELARAQQALDEAGEAAERTTRAHTAAVQAARKASAALEQAQARDAAAREHLDRLRR